jgi:CRISPR/Cas system-associated protein Csx1
MKMLFSMDEQVHHFKITGEITPEDLQILKGSFHRFLDSNPEFVVVDLSEITLQVPDFDLQTALTEIRTLASAKGISIQIAMSDIEAGIAKDSVLQSALERQIRVLQGKIELREEMKRNLEQIIDANRQLKSAIEEKNPSLTLNRRNPFNPLFERLWSEK